MADPRTEARIDAAGAVLWERAHLHVGEDSVRETVRLMLAAADGVTHQPPLAEEIDNQKDVPARGDAKPGAHAG